MTEYDMPWKEVLDVYLQDFLELCLPDIHQGIDWSAPVENHEQELPKLFPDSLTAGRVVDKLFRAKFKANDLPTWFLIHTEVQVNRQVDFPKRMFTCYYRVVDRFREPVVCIAILGDTSKSWRPLSWEFELFGCGIEFRYPVVKLLDFALEIEALQRSMNPFATVIAAHLRAQASSANPSDRYRFKVELVRSLYEKQWTSQRVRQLFRFIDWVMELPAPLVIQFRDTLKSIESEKNMPYVTSIEQLAKDEGKIEGKIEGMIMGRIQMLQEVLGLPVMATSQLESMTGEQLSALYEELRKRLEKN